MKTNERVKRMFEHKEADRIPITDVPWGSTLQTWKSQGMPDVSFEEYFQIDRFVDISVDNSPRLPVETLEETDEYRIYTTSFGATLKNFKKKGSTPDFMDFAIKTPDDWARVKERITPSSDRINWKKLKKNHHLWKEQGAWIQAGGWFGFDVTHSWMIGTERLLMAMVTHPEWIKDMFETLLDVNLALLDQIWEAGYRFDSFRWPDDMGYKNNQFFSLDMYRELLKPYHQKAIDWAHSKNIKAHLHSCGDVDPMIPELMDMGLDALNPLEVKAGMDPVEIKKKYGKALVLHGGINAVLWDDLNQIIPEIKEKVPILKKNGGYIFSSDHSIPESVTFDNMKEIMKTIKHVGSYERE